MRERLPAIPASGPKSAGRVREALEKEGHIFIRRGHEGNLVELVRRRVVEGAIDLHAAAEAIDALQVCLHIRAPLAGRPGGAGHLNARRGLYRKADGAVRLRGIEIVALGIGGYTHIIDLMKIIKTGAC